MWSERRIPVPDWRQRSEPTATGSPVLPRYIPKSRVAVVQATGDERLDQCNVLLASSDNDRTACRRSWGSWCSRHFDRPQRREPTVTAGYILFGVL